jgi:hypothetical protein
LLVEWQEWVNDRMRSDRRMPNTSIFKSSPRLVQAERFSPLVLLAIAMLPCCGQTLCAQTSDPPAAETTQPWSASTETQSDGVSLTRTTESHSQNGNRTLDNQSLQRRGSNGQFEPYQDIEKTTVKVDATTVRTTTRIFGRDSDGNKNLVQVIDEEQRTLPGGESNVVRSTSNPDANGKLQLAQREIAETRKTSKDAEETKTTVLLPSVNGGLVPSMKLDERRNSKPDGSVDSRKTTLVPDADGHWQVSEVRQATTTKDGNNLSTQESVSRSDSEGKLSEVSRTVTRESENAAGEKHNTVDQYSVDAPGSAPDGSLHLVERATTAERANTKGSQATQTVQARDANGNLDVVSVDTTKSDSTKIIQVQIAPAEPPK